MITPFTEAPVSIATSETQNNTLHESTRLNLHIASVLPDDVLCHATRQDHLSVHGLREPQCCGDEDIVNATLKDDVP
jgi:hypothetical protein